MSLYCTELLITIIGGVKAVENDTKKGYSFVVFEKRKPQFRFQSHRSNNKEISIVIQTPLIKISHRT